MACFSGVDILEHNTHDIALLITEEIMDFGQNNIGSICLPFPVMFIADLFMLMGFLNPIALCIC